MNNYVLIGCVAFGGVFVGFFMGWGVFNFMAKAPKDEGSQSLQGSGKGQGVEDFKTEFISNVTHDLKSPLASIVSYTEYLLSEKEVKQLILKHAEYIAVIRSQCLHLMNIVNNILDMGRIQAGRLELLNESVSIEKVAWKVRQLFEIPAKEKGITLVMEVSRNLPEVWGDGARIQQVMTNLISNALKFTPSGGSIKIGARRIPELKQGLLYVTDTGTGIPPEEVPRMFDRFHRINPAEQSRNKIRGTGLGLAICKGIVEKWGGKIWLQSMMGKGTTFFVTLPMKNEERDNGRPSSKKRQGDPLNI